MSDATMNTADLFEIIRTTRSMRRLKPDPVPNDAEGALERANLREAGMKDKRITFRIGILTDRAKIASAVSKARSSRRSRIVCWKTGHEAEASAEANR